MIFSKLFSSKANWQHKDVSIRVNSIENELRTNNDQDQQILRQIIDNDPSDMVRRAALIKVDIIDLWLEKGLSDASNSTVTLAQNKLVDFIADENEAAKVKLSLIEQTNKSLAEKMLAKALDVNIVIALLEKIEKPYLFNAIFSQKQITNVQHYIVEKTVQVSTLEKLLKKTELPEIVTLINDKIASIKALTEKPLKIQKEGQLILSKLLALKDMSSYQDVVEKRKTLENQWQHLSTDFSCLTDDIQTEFREKYDHISDTLIKIFAVKEEQYQQAKIAETLAVEQAATKIKFTQFVEETAQEITTTIFNNVSINETEMVNTIKNFNLNVSTSHLSKKDKAFYLKQGTTLSERLSKIDEIANSVTNATHLISKMAQQQPPQSLAELSTKQSIFTAWISDWNANMVLANSVLPESITNAFDEIHSSWNQAITPLKKAREKNFHQCQRKISDLNRLLANGKYNAAFGVFNHFKQLFELLSSDYQKRLNREFEHLSAKMDELSDWEHYIATPRKQQLLVDVQALVETPLDNPYEQANKVKAFRQTWNSLGHADETVDHELNNKFNEACEKAFAPCRQFYAEQDKLREQHLIIRHQALQEAKELQATLDNTDLDIKKIDTRLSQVIKKWHNAGEVDGRTYKKINGQFQSAIKPIKQRVNQYHNVNVDAKQKIIMIAQGLLEQEDAFNAVDKIKSLQTKWKTIGYAGVHKENELWHKFKAINDNIFAKRSELQGQRKKEKDVKLEIIKQKLAVLYEAKNEQNSTKLLHQLIDQANELISEINNDTHPIKSSITLIEKFILDCHNQIKTINKQTTQQDWQLIFSLITQLASNEITQEGLAELVDYQELSNGMKSHFNTAANFNNTEKDRLIETIELEIIAGVGSPKQDQQLRMERQIQLMQQKMASGSLNSTNDKFWQWLSVGKLTEQDLTYIERVKVIFLPSLST